MTSPARAQSANGRRRQQRIADMERWDATAIFLFGGLVLAAIEFIF